jgi:hypothetical protein
MELVNKEGRMTRRESLKRAAGAFMILPAGLARGYAANEKLNLGVIGLSGQGQRDAQELLKQGENIAAICDVDSTFLDLRTADYPKAKKYTDFRKMIESEKLDGVVVATPDHTHAYISVWAMKHGVNVYCQKPLCKTVHEARIMAKVAAETKVITQMGTFNMGQLETIRSGVLGEITEVHVPTDRPIWPQGFTRPTGEDPVPSSLDWDIWIGPAPFRPFKARYPEGHAVYTPPPEKQHQLDFKSAGLSPIPPVGVLYHPFVFRGWLDFGSGALGDIASHSMNVIFMALDLGPPSAVDIIGTSGMTKDMYPDWSILRFEWPQRGAHPPLKIFWYDGGKVPPKEITGGGRGGMVWIGTKGSLPAGRGPFFDQKTVAPPQSPRESAGSRPVQIGAPQDEVHKDWCDAVKAGKQAPCHFGYSGPFTEAYQLGNVALRVGQRIEWDSRAFRITNSREANQYLTHEYRKGWDLKAIAGSAAYNV